MGVWLFCGSGDILPRLVVRLIRQQPDEQRGEGDDAARSQQYCGGKGIPHAAVKAQMRLLVTALCNGGKLPCVHEHSCKNGEDRGDLICHGVDAVGIAA